MIETYPVFAAGFLHASLTLATDTVARGAATNSAEVTGTVAGGEIWAVASGHGQAEERGNQDKVLHFAVGKSAKVLSTRRNGHIYQIVV